MAYIRFNVTKITDGEGRTVSAKVNRMESDLPSLSTLQPNIIFNGLSHKGRVRKWLELDDGLLDRDMLAGADYLYLDKGLLDCDFML